MIRFEMDDLHILNWPSLSYHYIINSISQFNTILSIATNITFENGVGNDMNIPMTSLNFTRFVLLKRIEIGNNCFTNIREFVIDGLASLESLIIGKNCFGISEKERDDGICRITNCPNLRQLEIGDASFRDFKSFMLFNLNSIQSIKFGWNCFQYADFSLKGE